MRRTVLLVLLATACSAQVSWGPTGHATLAAIARGYLGSNAAKLCQTLLPEVQGDLSQVASWADDVRTDPAYKWSAPLHFINTPDWVCTYTQSRDCKGGVCVDGAIQNFTSRVANTKLSQAQRAEALKFLVHFIGDIHQPLHVGFKSDLGGNTITGTFMGSSTNLHSLWDSGVINKRLSDDFSRSAAKWLSWLQGQLKGAWSSKINGWKRCQSSAPSSACSSDWASESIGLACSNAYVNSDGKTHLATGFKLDDAYYNRNIPVIEQQVAKGGIRLANVLNSIAP